MIQDITDLKVRFWKNVKDKLKGKAIVYMIRAYTNEKYHLRRAILNPIIRKKIDEFFKEAQMEDEKSKWKSKTFWTAIIGVMLGAVQPISAALGHPVEVPTWVYEVLVAFGLYAVRDGIGKKLK